MKRIGIYAGTFDPIHNGHLAFARDALRRGTDMVYFLPEPRPRRKQGVRALEHRVGMIESAIHGEPKLGIIRLEQARFTVQDTLPVIEQRFPGVELVFLFGDDVIWHLADWPNVSDLVSRVSLLVAIRQDSYPAVERRLTVLASTTGRAFRYEIIPSPAAGISSSLIRQNLKRHETPRDVPDSVSAYMHRHRLYR